MSLNQSSDQQYGIISDRFKLNESITRLIPNQRSYVLLGTLGIFLGDDRRVLEDVSNQLVAVLQLRVIAAGGAVDLDCAGLLAHLPNDFRQTGLHNVKVPQME